MISSITSFDSGSRPGAQVGPSPFKAGALEKGLSGIPGKPFSFL
jgi:hypothetical protein